MHATKKNNHFAFISERCLHTLNSMPHINKQCCKNIEYVCTFRDPTNTEEDTIQKSHDKESEK